MDKNVHQHHFLMHNMLNNLYITVKGNGRMLNLPLQPQPILPPGTACSPHLRVAGAPSRQVQPLRRTQQHALAAGFQPLSLQASSFISS